MAELEPLWTLHYNLARTGGLQDVVAPPYDVIDEHERAELEARSPYNVVHIDLPRGNGDPYEHAAMELSAWRREGVIVADDQPALWPLAQEYTGPDGKRRTRRGFLARVRVTEYGAGRIRPHERTHPGPKEDRLRLTRATRTNLSPIFSLVLRSIRRRVERARTVHRSTAVGRDDRRRWDGQPPLAGRRSGGDRSRKTSGRRRPSC